MKRLEKQTVHEYRPDLTRVVSAPPVYPDMGFTMWTPEYVPVEGGYAPVVPLPVEVEVEVEYLSVGELRDAIKDLPSTATVRFFDDEYAEFREASRVIVGDDSLDLE